MQVSSALSFDGLFCYTGLASVLLNFVKCVDCSVHGWNIPFSIIWKVIKLCLIKQQLVCKHMLTGTLERSYWFLTLQNPCLTWRLFFALQLFNIATVSNTVTSYRVGPERPTPVGSCPKQVGSCAASAMWCTCEGGLGQQGEAWANYQTQSVETLGTIPSWEEILRPLCSVDHSCWSVDMMCISLFDWSNSEVFYQQV